MTKNPDRCDVLILTSSKEDMEAVRSVALEGSEWEAYKDPSDFVFFVRSLQSGNKSGLRLALAQTTDRGEVNMAMTGVRLVHHLRPRCLAICGTCAGRRTRVFPGDVIVADRMFKYDRGEKVVRGKGKKQQQQLKLDTMTYQLDPRWKQRAESFTTDWAVSLKPHFNLMEQKRWLMAQLMDHPEVPPTKIPRRLKHCPNWPDVVSSLQNDELLSSYGYKLTQKGVRWIQNQRILYPDGYPKRRPFNVHVGPIATGSWLIEDDSIFDRLGETWRTMLGLETEAVVAGMIAEQEKIPRMIVVKGVLNYADAERDHTFKGLANQAAANFLLSFLSKEMPERVEEEERPDDSWASSLHGFPLVPGYVMQGRYRLDREIGRGGFGRVWHAHDTETQRDVAVKILHPRYNEEPEERNRFFRGARVLAGLKHDSLIRILCENGYDQVRDYHFYVMELIEGHDLAKMVINGTTGREQLLDIILTIGEGVAYAHKQGVIHRDIKPANILVADDGRAWLTDFDLVRAPHTAGGTNSKPLGTFMFAAPEVLENGKDANISADIYALAMTTIFAMYGQRLPSITFKDPSYIIDKLPSCNQQLKAVLKKGTAWDQSRRYASMEAFCAALKETTRPQAITQQGDWVPIQSGEFRTGQDRSKPSSSILITDNFWMARYPLTNAEYQHFIDDGGYEKEQWWSHDGWIWLNLELDEFEKWFNTHYPSPGHAPAKADMIPVKHPKYKNQINLANARQPVVGVSFYEAEAYCAWLTHCLEQCQPDWWFPEMQVQIPTEIQWEYSARGVFGRRYPWGDKPPHRGHANYGRHINQPSEVGRFPEGATPEGCYDFAGNVWEWCYVSKYGQMDRTKTGSWKQKHKALRGGAWNCKPLHLEAAFRTSAPAAVQGDLIGFRCCIVTKKRIGNDHDHGGARPQ